MKARIMRPVFVLSALAMAACTVQPSRAGADPAGTEESREGIEGRFIVVTVDGAAPVINIEGHQPTVTIDAGRIHFQSQCIYADWTYIRSGGMVSTKPYYEPGSGMCARARRSRRPARHFEGFGNRAHRFGRSYRRRGWPPAGTAPRTVMRTARR